MSDDNLPILETTCPECRGSGTIKDDGERADCFECNGAGAIPTEAGKKILHLMEGNLRRMIASLGLRLK